MKISKIKISKFHQFEDFELDLTYPKGHEKAGKPLDKVCFIGQSGTGKTTLLEMIRQACLSANFSGVQYPYNHLEFQPKQGAIFSFKNGVADDFNMSISNAGVSALSKDLISPIVKTLIYFSTGLSQAEINTDLEVSDFEESDSTYSISNESVLYFPISKDSIKIIWDNFYRNVRKHQTLENDYYLKLIRRAQSEKKDIAIESLDEWRKANPNPLEMVAINSLDPLLNKFHLAVKTEFDKTSELNALQIRSLSEGITIPYESLSTGTKQIIFTAFPIYQLLQDDSIVLMDEPETSLYPDIQREIIPYYTSFDKNKTSQFFFATHSPIIASAFEPWEIVELKFNEKGKVYREEYYPKGEENHVDNYKIDPRYLRWDDILTKVFDLDDDSNAEFRTAKLTEYATLKDKIKAWREEGKLENPTQKIKDEVAEFERMYDLLTGNWASTNHAKN